MFNIRLLYASVAWAYTGTEQCTYEDLLEGDAVKRPTLWQQLAPTEQAVQDALSIMLADTIVTAMVTKTRSGKSSWTFFTDNKKNSYNKDIITII